MWKVVLSNCIGIKMNTIWTGVIIIYLILFILLFCFCKTLKLQHYHGPLTVSGP